MFHRGKTKSKCERDWRGWNADQEEWYFSAVDIVAVLTDSADPNNYWKVLKNRLKKEGSELVTNCNRLKLRSPKAEPFKMWLAQVERDCPSFATATIHIKDCPLDKGKWLVGTNVETRR